MKIVVSINELASETQSIVDNLRRSNAPVFIGDPNKPTAILLSPEEYERLQRQAQRAAVPETTQPIASPPVAVEVMPAAQPVTAIPASQPVVAQVIPALENGNVAQRAAAAVQADRMSPEPKSGSPRPPASLSSAARPAQRSVRLNKPPLPKPPAPLQPPRPRGELSIAAIPGGWQTVALVAGVLALGILGFALIVNALGG